MQAALLFYLTLIPHIERHPMFTTDDLGKLILLSYWGPRLFTESGMEKAAVWQRGKSSIGTGGIGGGSRAVYPALASGD
ncbi:MAG: hypothetical protein Q4C79_07915 [Neisseria sp.]|uniref:hypothetical protein n=1 Tax=Neisseria sp. TaxID=192066 RepID=UPI0026DC3F95|nr:hypothetical protein [Neisseria sp.]MDO4248864.1 hypothetical protein [Neisseria sp.]